MAGLFLLEADSTALRRHHFAQGQEDLEDGLQRRESVSVRAAVAMYRQVLEVVQVFERADVRTDKGQKLHFLGNLLDALERLHRLPSVELSGEKREQATFPGVSSLSWVDEKGVKDVEACFDGAVSEEERKSLEQMAEKVVDELSREMSIPVAKAVDSALRSSAKVTEEVRWYSFLFRVPISLPVFFFVVSVLLSYFHSFISLHT